MAKYRVSSKGNQVIVKSRLARDEKIHEQEIRFFYGGALQGCFYPKVENPKNIIYMASDVIVLKKYLKNPIDDGTFFSIVAQTLEMAKRVEQFGLNMGNLVFDINLVFICEHTREVFFLYQPIAGKCSVGNIYAFITDITKIAGKTLGGMSQHLNYFQEFMRNPMNYRMVDIELYIREICPQAYQNIAVVSPAKSAGTESVQPAAQYNDGNDATVLLHEDSGETEWLNDDEGTVVLVEEEDFAPHLRRVRTGEKILIEKRCFVIGKDASCDFSVPDNKAVSRRHAVIERDEGAYYLSDNRSKNHTYVNEQMLADGERFELEGGIRIRLADEVFEFGW